MEGYNPKLPILEYSGSGVIIEHLFDGDARLGGFADVNAIDWQALLKLTVNRKFLELNNKIVSVLHKALKITTKDALEFLTDHNTSAYKGLDLVGHLSLDGCSTVPQCQPKVARGRKAPWGRAVPIC